METQQQHQAVEGLASFLSKAYHDLNLVQLKLDKEFQHLYPLNANPMKLVARIKKIQDELLPLKEQCRELLSAKQDLIDKASSVLIGNRNMLQRLQASTGVPVAADSEDAAYNNFNQVIDEWMTQVRSRTGEDRKETATEDINKLLFSSIVRST